MQMEGILYGIGTGPGDPALITQKATAVIQSCELILIPAKSLKECYAYRIVKELIPEISQKTIFSMPFPMHKDEEKLSCFYEEMYQKIAVYLKKGQHAAFLTIGDPSVYSTYMYLEKRVKEHGGKTEMISGVPSFCAAAARLGISLGERDEQIHIIPTSYSVRETRQLSGTRIYMKSGKKLDELKQMLQEEMQDRVLEIYWITNCGMETETFGSGLDGLQPELGYLTIVIVKAREAEQKNSSRYFENRACQYYPCHKGSAHINCMFCYCPFYTWENCPGNPAFVDKKGKRIKTCLHCQFPHKAENYEKIMELLRTK